MIYTILWIAWGALFFAIEGAALLSRQPGTTLSEHIWAWFHVRDQRPTRITWVLRGALLAGLLLLTCHLAFGWWSL